MARRIYRSSDTGSGPYQLVAEIDTTSASFPDTARTDPTAVLDDSIQLGRPNGRLAIDPSMVVKLDGARFELELGAQMIAEGGDGREIIFTSIADDRYGAGGTFDTGNDGAIIAGLVERSEAGDWGGIYGGHLSNLNLDHAVFAYGGGVTRVEGTFTAFNVVEITTTPRPGSPIRCSSSTPAGQGGQGEANRFGRGFNEPGVIFVRQAQPVIYNNIFRNNPDDDPNTSQTNTALATPAININVNALNYVYKRDTGRTTGLIDRLEGYRDNQGPLILDNQLDDNEINGMVVRGQTLTTQSVWDDTDIVHVLFDTVYVSDFHTFGGLVLASSPTESLVVKLLGAQRRLCGQRHSARDRRPHRRHHPGAGPARLARGADLVPRRPPRGRARGRTATRKATRTTTAASPRAAARRLEQHPAGQVQPRPQRGNAVRVRSARRELAGANGSPDSANCWASWRPASMPETKTGGWASPSRASCRTRKTWTFTASRAFPAPRSGSTWTGPRWPSIRSSSCWTATARSWPVRSVRSRAIEPEQLPGTAATRRRKL